VDLKVMDQTLIRYLVFTRYCEKKWVYNGMVHQAFIDFKKACDSRIKWNTSDPGLC
jgi:hypothetical protein